MYMLDIAGQTTELNWMIFRTPMDTLGVTN